MCLFILETVGAGESSSAGRDDFGATCGSKSNSGKWLHRREAWILKERRLEEAAP